MTIKNLIDKTTFEDIKEQLIKHYGNNNINKYKELYFKLKKMTAGNDVNKSTLFINVFDFNDLNVINKEFDENDTNLDFDVCLAIENEETVYSIASSSYTAYLSYFIEEHTLNKMSYAAILAHSLWEITAYSFDDTINDLN